MALSKKLHNLNDSELSFLANVKTNGFRGFSGLVTPDPKYTSVAEKTRNYRSFEFGHVCDSKTSQRPELTKFLNAENVWPAHLDIQDAADMARQEFHTLALKMLSEILSVSAQSLAPFFSNPTGYMRLLWYPESDDANIPFHYDYEFITLIHASHPSLFIRDRDKILELGETPDHLVLLAGDALHYITNSEIPVAEHGAKPSQERFSTVYFLNSNSEVSIDKTGKFYTAERSNDRFSPAEHVVGMNLANNQILRNDPSNDMLMKYMPADFKNPFRKSTNESN